MIFIAFAAKAALAEAIFASSIYVSTTAYWATNVLLDQGLLLVSFLIIGRYLFSDK
jgi:hypothetical protein